MGPKIRADERSRHELLLEEGVDIRFVQRLLGHGGIAATEIHTRVNHTALKEEV